MKKRDAKEKLSATRQNGHFTLSVSSKERKEDLEALCVQSDTTSVSGAIWEAIRSKLYGDKLKMDVEAKVQYLKENGIKEDGEKNPIDEATSTYIDKKVKEIERERMQ